MWREQQAADRHTQTGVGVSLPLSLQVAPSVLDDCARPCPESLGHSAPSDPTGGLRGSNERRGTDFYDGEGPVSSSSPRLPAVSPGSCALWTLSEQFLPE